MGSGFGGPRKPPLSIKYHCPADNPPETEWVLSANLRYGVERIRHQKDWTDAPIWRSLVICQLDRHIGSRGLVCRFEGPRIGTPLVPTD